MILVIEVGLLIITLLFLMYTFYITKKPFSGPPKFTNDVSSKVMEDLHNSSKEKLKTLRLSQP